MLEPEPSSTEPTQGGTIKRLAGSRAAAPVIRTTAAVGRVLSVARQRLGRWALTKRRAHIAVAPALGPDRTREQGQIEMSELQEPSEPRGEEDLAEELA